MRNVYQSRGLSMARPLALVACAACCVATFSTATFAKEAEWIWSPAYEKEARSARRVLLSQDVRLGQPRKRRRADRLRRPLRVVRQRPPRRQRHELEGARRLRHHASTWSNGAEHRGRQRPRTPRADRRGWWPAWSSSRSGNTHVEHSTDDTWKTALKEFPQWQKPRFDDSQWLAARSFGALDATLPWGNEVTVAGDNGPLPRHARVSRRMGRRSQGDRLADLHDVRRVRPDHRLARKRPAGRHSRRRQDGLVDTVATYCDEIEKLPGSAGHQRQGVRRRRRTARRGLYGLTDEDQDGRVDGCPTPC